MKYQVIARRYRPRRFEEVVGQESVAATLRSAIVQGRLAHAYLFAGPRGIGKTSMARIFAKALDCPRAGDRKRAREEWGVGCDECDVCRAIQAGEDIDVLEVDGASYRGIEDVRDIVDNVKFVPSRSPYKVFIIDEVHMLTREAFNALLKTIEEPPAHVKFIFATTEPHKIPETVLSRCQRFDFRPIGEPDIVKRLEQICAAEGVEAEEGLLLKVARYGKGGLRDAQTLLDQAITFAEPAGGGRPLLKSADLERITGRLPEEAVDRVVAALSARDPRSTLKEVEACFESGADPATLLDQVAEKLHRSLLSAVDGAAESGGTGGAGELDLALGRLQVLHETALKLRGSPYPRLAVELALTRLARMEDPRAMDEALAYLKKMEGRLCFSEEASAGAGPAVGAGSAAPPPATAPRASAAVSPAAAPAAVRSAAPPAAAPASVTTQAPAAVEPAAPTAALTAARSGGGEAGFDFPRLRSLWDQILVESRQRFPHIAAFLQKTRLREGRERGQFTVVFESEFHLKQLREPRRAQEFEGLVREVTGVPWRMGFEIEGPAAAAAEKPAGERGDGSSIKNDPLVKKSVDLFKGRVL